MIEDEIKKRIEFYNNELNELREDFEYSKDFSVKRLIREKIKICVIKIETLEELLKQ